MQEAPYGARGCSGLSMALKACVGWRGFLRRKCNDTLPAVTACIDFHVFLNHANSSNSVSGDAHEMTACQVICCCPGDVALGQQGAALQLFKSGMEGSNRPLPVPERNAIKVPVSMLTAASVKAK